MEKILKTIHGFFSEMARSSSPNEDYINRLFLWFLILAFVIMIIVVMGVLVGIIRYRSKHHQHEPEQITGIKWLEITWTVVPFLILLFFFYFTVRFMKDIDQPVDKNRQADIIITARQWWWEMQYPKYNITTANELHIPVQQKLLMRVESADVIHDWWVPELGRKIDAIPGTPNYSWLEASDTGEYRGACSEYCGTQHAGMRILVISESEVEFARWVQAQQKVPLPPVDSVGRKGMRLFSERTCAGCHSISGTVAMSHIGPDLTHLASRKTLISGVLTNTPENLYLWLQNPQKIKEGSHMPNFILSNDELKALVNYLEELK
jgi:cytochrome c oxidase subunit II